MIFNNNSLKKVSLSKKLIHFFQKSISQGIAVPLTNPIFRLLWVGNFLSNLGTMMHAVAAAWLMTSLTTSPLLIGLVQTAFNLPVLLLGIPCGVLADLFDRRRLLIIAQCWMMAAALLMALVAGLGKMSPSSLLILLFLLGMGAALHFPTWLALLQNLVAQEHVPAAVSLNSIAFNLARTLGPALGGFCVYVLGAPLIFLANGLSFIAVLFGLKQVPPDRLSESTTTANDFFLSVVEIGSFMVASPRIAGLLVRLALFMVAGSGFWGLLPLIAREHLHLSANGYGGLLSAFGLGSILGALFLPRLRFWFSVDAIIATSSLVFTATLLLLVYASTITIAALAMAFVGLTWVLVIVNYNVSIQLTAPDHLKGRMISLYVVIFQGGIGLSSALAGWLAAQWGYQQSLMLGSAIVVASLLLIPFFPVPHEAD